MRGVTDTNGYGGASPEHASASDSEGDEASAGSGGENSVELLAEDLELPARALASLNALRKSREHFDVLLVAGGEETPAHKAVLAAASPYLLETLLAEPLHRVTGVDAASLRALVEWAYTGRLVAAAGQPARKLYEAAWRLRVEGARLALAERLVRRATPADALELRSLPDLPPQHRHHLDTFIAAHFDEICASGALAALPLVTAELLRESSAEDGAEAPRAVADAALVWLRERPLDDDLYARTHLLFVDGGGELRDCGELPSARTDAPELQEYRREAVERRRREPAAGATPKPLAGAELGARSRARGAGGDCAVLAARALGPRATQALLAVHGRLVAARVAWRAAGGPVARGGKLGHTQVLYTKPLAGAELGARSRARGAGGDCAVLAARALGPRATQALLAVHGRLVAARVAWRAAGGPVARGGKLGHTQVLYTKPLAGAELGAQSRARGAGGDCAVLAARALGPRATQALLAVHGRLVAARVAWRAAGGPVARGGKLGHTQVLYTKPLAGAELGARSRARGAGGDCAVLAARALGPRATQALLAVHGRLVAARVAWRAAGGPVARGGKLGYTQDAPPEPDGERRAELAGGRCAHGTAALGQRLLVCGGYDRARVLRGCEAYCPATNAWTALADMRGARARFPAAALGGRLYVLGGSDGHNELDSVDAFEEDGSNGPGRWVKCARLPGARSYAAAAADPARGTLYVLGGWAGGRSLKAVHRYDPASDSWSDAPALTTGRSQCCALSWRGALWALGGCDAWRCLANTELLSLADPESGWAPGPLLPSARRSMGGCAWRGRLVLAGGSDGAASLRRVDWLIPGPDPAGGTWQAGPALRRARAGLGLGELCGALYAAGGFSGRDFLACVEWLPAPDAEWTMLAEPPQVPRALSSPGAAAGGERASLGEQASLGEARPSEKVEHSGQGEATAQ